MESSRSLVLMLALLSGALAAATTASGVLFDVVNGIDGTEAGRQFDADVGADYARAVLAEASHAVWRTLGQRTDADRKSFETVTLIVEGVPAFRESLTRGNVIHLGGGGGRRGDEGRGAGRFHRDQVRAVIFHVAANVWQFDGKGHVNPGLLAGIADLVQMRAGCAPESWAGAGEGERWDERRPGVTARFLDFCDAHTKGFMAELGRNLKNRRYRDHFFLEITGKTVEKLWAEYKRKYNAN
ncbi:unnamed protein product [Urochloa humidicola]